MATPGQITKIHALKGALKLDEKSYRNLLSAHGVKSTKDRACTIVIADRIIVDMEKDAISSGVWEKRKPAKKADAVRRLADDPQSKMLRAMWIELHEAGIVRDPSETALCHFGKRLTRKDALQWYSDRDVTVVKQALKQMLERGKP